MNLTQTQRETIKQLEENLSEQLWDHLYYGDNPNPDIVKLFREGVELNFKVTLKPYTGVEHPEYQG